MNCDQLKCEPFCLEQRCSCVNFSFPLINTNILTSNSIKWHVMPINRAGTAIFQLEFVCILGSINVTLQVWDIGGQQLGGNMLETYLYGAHVSSNF